MVHSTSCPDATRWQALLADGDLSDSAELEAHLAGCSRCRTVLDELAVGDSGWLRDAGRLATSTANDPEMTKTLHRLRDYFPDDAHGPPIPLDFLTPSDQPGLIGTLGRYQVLEVIGRGAMGIVLKAIDPDLLRPVAIKVLAPYLASSGTARARFLREARAAAAVSHDHVVTIHAVESVELPFLVMEFISGISLQARIDRDGPLSPKDIARIGLQAANGLQAAHAVGLVHRDIKPANILLENGVERVKITDFGLARAADDARLTQSGTAAGTPLYMSPEQARGETVDPRSDLFSLGSVLYTLATGFPPFRAGSTMGVLNRIANDPPRPIRETVPDFPAALETIIMQLLEKDPARRIQVAADVAIKLTAYLADPQPEPRRPRRRLPKAWAGLIPVLAGILILGTVLYFKTSKGTLVVEVNDPAVMVQIEGDELSISGAGPQVVKLKPGTYVVKADQHGKKVVVDPQVVTIERNGKQVVKVTVKPDEVAAREPEAEDVTRNNLLERRLAEYLPQTEPARLDLIRLAWKEARWPRNVARRESDGPVVQTHPRFPDVLMLVNVAGRPSTPDDRVKEALGQASVLAATILKDTAHSAALMRPKDAPKIDPAWDAVLKPMIDQYQSLAARLAGTKGNVFITIPGPVTDLDKATADLKEPDRAKVRRLLALRDRFALNFPKAQQQAVKVAQARPPAGDGKQVEPLENELRVQHEALANTLIELETVAAELGARPLKADALAADTDREATVRKLVEEFNTLTEALSKTTLGKVLTLTGRDRDKFGLPLFGDDEERVRKLIAAHDRFRQHEGQFQKDIGRWEQAGVDARTARQKFAAGTISGNELDKAELALKDADRPLAAAQRGMEKAMTELRALGKELVPAKAEDSIEVDLKKVMAEYDALVLRLVNTPTGRVLALLGPERSWLPGDVVVALNTTEEKAKPGIKLMEMRREIRSQSAMADTALMNRNNNRVQRARAATDKADPAALAVMDQNIARNEHEAKVRVIALRGLVDDLKKLADEIDPPPGPDAEFQKLMAEYDALVLRLAEVPVGQVLALFPEEKGWNSDQVRKHFGGSGSVIDLAIWLLEKRDQIRAQADRARKAVTTRANLLRGQADQARAKTPPADAALTEEAIKTQENELKLRTVTLRGLIGEVKKFADENAPKKGK